MTRFNKARTGFEYYDYINDDNKLVTGEERKRAKEQLGDWSEMEMPDIKEIRKENPNLFNEILSYFGMNSVY